MLLSKAHQQEEALMGIDDGGAVTALLGLDEFVVRAQVHDGVQWWLAIETAADVVGCDGCGSRAIGHGRRRVKVRDLPIAGEPVTLVWAKRIWRCGDPDCAVKMWSEVSEEIEARAVLTERARAEIACRVGPGEESVAAVARSFGVSWHPAMGLYAAKLGWRPPISVRCASSLACFSRALLR
jgi:hypothetical protein